MHSTLLPREKLHRLGAQSLQDWELWSCVLQMGSRKYPIADISRHLSRFSLSSAFPPTLLKCFGDAQLARVLAIQELCRRTREVRGRAIRSVEDVVLGAQNLRTARQEYVQAWYCSTLGEVVHEAVVAIGTLNAAAVGPREIFSVLGLVPFDSLVLVHNHPSGDVQPSAADLVFTARLEAACEIMGCWLRDHVIVGKKGQYSFRENGRLTSGPWETFPAHGRAGSLSPPE